MKCDSGPVRVLILDDDPVYRRILTQCFASLGSMVRVVSAVSSVEAAQRAVDAGGIDLVTLDVVLENGSGLDFLPWVNKKHPNVISVLVTSGTEKRASQTVDAMLLGATTLVRKPSGPGAPAKLREDLERVIAGICPRPATRPSSLSTTTLMLMARRELVAIGASTGGPPVVLQFCKDLPQSLRTPLFITQHMPLSHLKDFIELLKYPGGRKVVAASDGAIVEPNSVVVAGGDFHLGVVRRGEQLVVQELHTPAENFCRPAVDPMFRAVAACLGRTAVGVVMTGMGSDGAKGAVALQSKDAPVVVQDEATSVVWGMPGATVAAGAASAIVPAAKLGQTVAGLITRVDTHHKG